jgi:hypothetical protein
MTDTDSRGDSVGTDAEEFAGVDGSSEPNAPDGTDRERSDSGGDRAEGRGGDDRSREPTRSGRRLVAVVFVGSVLLAGSFGYLVGDIGPRALGAVGVFGLMIFEPTPVGMALYGMTVTGLVLGILYVGARFALRRESEAKQPSRDR